MNWRDEIIRALTQLGGEATLEEIYAKVRDNTNKAIPATYRAVIRNALETNSSDSANFHDVHDVFYCVHGKGMGVWGLRNFNVSEENMDTTQDDRSFQRGGKISRNICVEKGIMN